MAKKQPLVDSAVAQIIKRSQPDQAPAKPDKPNPLGVPLEQAEIDQLTAIAAELGLKRHHVMQYAIRQFLADWARGKRPKLAKKVTYTLQPD